MVAVEPDDIELVVTAASINVEATITPRNMSVALDAQKTLTQLRSNTTTLSAIVHRPIESMTGVKVVYVPLTSPHKSTMRTSPGLSGGSIAAIVLCVTFAVGAMLICLRLTLGRRRGTALMKTYVGNASDDRLKLNYAEFDTALAFPDKREATDHRMVQAAYPQRLASDI